MSGSSSHLRRPYAAVALACAITAGVATFLPWATGFGGWSEIGVEHTEGLITLVAAFNGALAAALASRAGISLRAYIRWALASGASMLIASFWFRMTVVGDADPVYDGALVDCFSYPCGVIEAGLGLVIAIVASASYLVAVTISAIREPEPRTGTDFPSARRVNPGPIAD